jgi:O-antigen ligase
MYKLAPTETRSWAVAPLCAALAALVVVFVSISKPLQGLGALCAIFFPAAAWLTGNPRTFFLWGLMATAPLEFSKYFDKFMHFGGEVAFRLEASDVFFVPLLLLWARDLWRGRAGGVAIGAPGVFWLLLIALGLFDVVVGPWRKLAAYEVVRMAKVFLLFALIVNNTCSVGRLRETITPLFLGVVIQSVYGILQYVTKSNFGFDWLGEPEQMIVEQLGFGGSRVGALMVHPNVFGGFLAMVLPILVALLFSPVTFYKKALCVVTLLLGEAALVLTLSRAAWIAFGLAVLFVLFISYAHPWSRRRFTLTRLLVVAGILILCIAFSEKIVDRILLSDPNAVSSRFALNDTAWRMVQDRPILGFGLNSWSIEMVPYITDPVLSLFRGDIAPPVHNIYYIFWVEQGTVGLILFLALAASVLALGWRNFRVRDPLVFAVNAGCMAGFAASLVHGLADWILRINPVMRTFWILAGIIVAIGLIRRREERDARTPPAPAE